MRPESGVNLVSGALQSSLARAQKNYQFHGKKSSYNSEEKQQLRKEKNLKKKLKDYCATIGSNFASYSAKQLLDYGNSLEFEEGGLLEPGISEELKEKYTVLKQNAWPPAGGIEAAFASYSRNKNKPKIKTATKGIPCDISAETVSSNLVSEPSSSNSLLRGKNSVSLTTSPSSKTVGKLENCTEKVIKLLQDKTIGKSKRKRLLKKLKQLQNKFEIVKPDSSSPLKVKQTTVAITPVLKDPRKNKLSSFAASNTNTAVEGKKTAVQNSKLLKQAKGMGPDADKNGDTSMSNGSSTTNHQLPEPKRVLYPKEKILLGWRQKRSPGAGFHNFGNTCYLNSSLQALFHIPAFVNWLQGEDDHRKNCNGILPNQSPCIICVVFVTLQEHSKSSSAIRPRVLDKLRTICKHFSYGRQEDAHEFLRYLLEGMERSFLMANNGLRLDNRTKETNPLGQIFGGYIRTEVTCLKCNFVSTTFQPLAELQLDIRHVTTLEDALQQHFRKERLDNNDYKCEKCRTISQATKQFSLELPPLVLCLQLKRFTLYGNKISKRIHCNRFLNMSRYIHKSRKDSSFREHELKYRLVALVTHMGQSPNCGHYTAIAEGCNGMYYQFDDQFVYQVSQQTALNNDAYVIIYEMEKSSRPCATETSSSAVAESSTAYSSSVSPKSATSSSGVLSASPGVPKKFTIPFSKANNNNGNVTSALRTSVMNNTDTNSIPKMNGPGSSIDRKVISFGVQKPLTNGPTNTSVTTPNKINILKPGVTLTNSSKIFPSSSSPVKIDSTVVTKASSVKLVPYNDIDNDDSEKEDQAAAPSVPSEIHKKKEHETKLEINKKLIGPVFEHLSPTTPPKSPKSSGISLSSQSSPKTSPEKTYGVKRKLDEILGTAKPTCDKMKQQQLDKTDKQPVLNATSKWTISSTKISNGYSSDPDVASQKPKAQLSAFSRAKSMERIVSKEKCNSVLNAKPSLIPNKSSNTQPSPVKTTKVVVTNGLPKKSSEESVPALVNGNHTHSSSPLVKKRKRSRSRSESSSSSSSLDSKKKRKKDSKKKKLRKEKRKGKKPCSDSSNSSSSSNDSESDSSGYRKRSKQHDKKKKHHYKSNDDSDESKSRKKEDFKSRKVSRETDSEERDRILRKARNPSRSPGPSRAVESADERKEKFHPSKINGREKSSWGGEDSLLSKSIEEERRRQLEKTSDEMFDEELDQGRIKKQRKSRSPSRDMDGSNKFQSLQDKKVIVNQWSSVLNGYGPGFKDHKTSPGGKKPWNVSHDSRFPPKFSPRVDKNFGDGGGPRNSNSYSASSTYRNNHKPGFRNYNGNNNRHNNHGYDKERNWKHRNHR